MATSNFLNETMSGTNPEKNETVPSDSDADFQYEDIFADDFSLTSLTEGGEDLEATFKNIHNQAEVGATVSPVTHPPEPVDAFLRNFLHQMEMTQTLECIQTEWAELELKGLADAQQVGVVPEVYSENQRQHAELETIRREGEEYRLAASAAAVLLDKARNARDVQKLHHQRVVDEKNKLIQEMRRLKARCNTYEPELKRLNEKYQAALKQTMKLDLENKAADLANRAAETSEQIQPATPPTPPTPANNPKGRIRAQPVTENVY